MVLKDRCDCKDEDDMEIVEVDVDENEASMPRRFSSGISKPSSWSELSLVVERLPEDSSSSNGNTMGKTNS